MIIWLIGISGSGKSTLGNLLFSQISKTGNKVRLIDGDIVRDFFNNDLELSEMTHKILSGHNENEVTFMPKNIKKLGFFERFFQLFS